MSAPVQMVAITGALVQVAAISSALVHEVAIIHRKVAMMLEVCMNHHIAVT